MTDWSLIGRYVATDEESKLDDIACQLAQGKYP